MRCSIAVAILAVVGLGPAMAQSFQTALPLSPAERRAIEARLSTILDFAEPNDVSRFALPSGRRVAVRPYAMVRRPGQRPCRGYRIDLFGETSRIAVDGFRCRRTDGRAWVIVEPELVLSQEGPIDVGIAPRAASEPLYGNDTPTFSAAPPPVPRPAPRAQVVAALTTQDTQTPAAIASAELPPVATIGTPLDPSDLDPSETGPLDLVPAPVTIPALSEADSAPLANAQVAPVADAQNVPVADQEPLATPEAPQPETTVAALEPSPASLPAREARVVGEPTARAEARWVNDGPVVEALTSLAYLEGAQPSAAEVDAAVDAFALDERFALPIAPGDLRRRLDQAMARTSSVPVCADGITQLCTMR
ncbi:MAG: hypothetical protein AAF318_02465 [Pseudomonadota bacterium]